MTEDRTQVRTFGLIVGSIFGAIGLWPAIVHGEDVRLWGLVLATALIAPALAAPWSLRPAFRGWMAVGRALGWINTRVLLGLIFFGLITPMGVVLRLTRRDPMQRAVDPGATTYRMPRPPRTGTHMRRQF